MRLLLKTTGLILLMAIKAMGSGAMDLTICEGFVDPVGLHDATPVFSWKLPAGVEKQTAYRIEVREKEVVWDSGWVDSDQSVFVPYGGTPLESRRQLVWRVDYKDQGGKAAGWSQPATFELGLLSSKDWNAKWIRPVGNQVASMPEFRLIKATYRSKAEPERKKDLTAFFQKKVKDNSLTVHVVNQALGGDPAEGSVKELELVYELDGEEKTSVVAEGNKGTFPQPKTDGEKVAWLRREFPVSGKVAKARLYVTARGLYQVSINGIKVGSDAFAPGWTSYANHIETRTYDVAEQLNTGGNALGDMPGAGWYAGRLGWKQHRGLYGRKPNAWVPMKNGRRPSTAPSFFRVSMMGNPTMPAWKCRAGIRQGSMTPHGAM